MHAQQKGSQVDLRPTDRIWRPSQLQRHYRLRGPQGQGIHRMFCDNRTRRNEFSGNQLSRPPTSTQIKEPEGNLRA